MQCSAWRPTSSASTRCGRCRAARGGTRAARRPPARRSTATCTGSSARRSTSGAGAAGRPPGRASAGSDLLDPHHGDQHLGQRRAHAPVALGLDHAHGAGLGHREIRATHRPPARTGTARAGAARAASASAAGSSVSSGRSAPAANRSRISARLRWIAGTRMCDWVSSPSCTISSARSVSTARMPAARQRLVQLDLVRGHRLDLDHLVDAVRAHDRRHERVRLARRRVPSAPVRRRRAPPPRAAPARRRAPRKRPRP